ncbi:hypothetical protein NCC49_002288 [Naganishia albida]|nr:hypothetical protein NCC49_002288 [Naganishia albida]
MFSNAYSAQPELDPSLTLQEHPYSNAHSIMLAQARAQKSAAIAQDHEEDNQYALPPIGQSLSRPSSSHLGTETHRPATSSGIAQQLTGSTPHNNPSELKNTNASGEYDPSPEMHHVEQTYNHLGMLMPSSTIQHQQQQHQRPEMRTQNSGYAVALPPISQDFARPSTSETRRPATSAGILQRSMAPGTFGAMSAFSSLDAQRRASIGLGTISEYQPQQQHLQSQQHHHQHLPHPPQTSSYAISSAQANYANALEQQRRQSDMSGYNGMFAHSIDGIDPNLTGMLKYMDITRRFSVPALIPNSTAPFQRPPLPDLSSVSTGDPVLHSARSMNNVRFNPTKVENTVDPAYDHRPGSSGGPIFPTDYRIGLAGGFDPATGTSSGFFASGSGDMTPQQQHQLYTLQSAASASGVFPPGSYSSASAMIDHRNNSYSSVSLDSRHDSLTESSRNPSLPELYLRQQRTSMDASRNPSLPDIYFNQNHHHLHQQRRPSTGHSTTLADAAAHQMGLLNHNEEPSSGPAHKKRPRRKFDQIERLYLCGHEGCTKAYGTLNHLNAHVSMQKHGQKRRPEEFKEIRAAWRRRKKEEAKEAAEHQAVMHGGHLDLEQVEKAAYEAQGKWLAH